jgi:O-methyltransferase
MINVKDIFIDLKVAYRTLSPYLTSENIDYLYSAYYTEREISGHKLDNYPLLDYPYQNRELLYSWVQHHIGVTTPIDYLEFGVFKGESIEKWITLNTHQNSRFYGFDSFEGLPEDWYSGKQKGHFDVGGAIPTINDSRVNFLKGWFNETLPAFVAHYNPANLIVIHLDADILSSTIYVLLKLDTFIKKGTVVVFDEFRGQEAGALNLYIRSSGKNYKILCARKDHVKVAIEFI